MILVFGVKWVLKDQLVLEVILAFREKRVLKDQLVLEVILAFKVPLEPRVLWVKKVLRVQPV